MFHSARVKLTAWYLLIIMFISASFSVAIYKVLASELDRVERIQRLRMERSFSERVRILPLPGTGVEPTRPFFLDPDLVAETKSRLIFILILTNTAILGGSFAAGYFLAGRTLMPIKQMVDEQNRFVADASHELRTPLTSLKTEIEVNLRDKGLVLEDAKKLLESNLEEINNLQVLSDDLIRLARYESGENGLTIEEVNLFSVTDEAVKKVANLARNKKITIENKVADHTIFGSKSALTELFVILLDNAIKYSLPKTTVILDSEKTDGHIFVRVIDQGVGISQEDVPHLFDRFYRVDESRSKSAAPGYGLGLSIAKQIIERHKGTVRVQSKLNEGTTFTVQLPIKHLHRFV